MQQHTYAQRAHNTHSPARLPVPVGRHPGLLPFGNSAFGTAQHSTAQHSTAHHSTAQHSTAQQWAGVPIPVPGPPFVISTPAAGLPCLQETWHSAAAERRDWARCTDACRVGPRAPMHQVARSPEGAPHRRMQARMRALWIFDPANGPNRRCAPAPFNPRPTDSKSLAPRGTWVSIHPSMGVEASTPQVMMERKIFVQKPQSLTQSLAVHCKLLWVSFRGAGESDRTPPVSDCGSVCNYP